MEWKIIESHGIKYKSDMNVDMPDHYLDDLLKECSQLIIEYKESDNWDLYLKISGYRLALAHIGILIDEVL